MKKFFALMLALCLLCGAAAVADDQEFTGSGQATMGIDMYIEEGSTLNNGFTVYIPEGISITQGSTKGYAHIRLDADDTDWWDNAMMVSVDLNKAENLCYGRDEETNEQWITYCLVNDQDAECWVNYSVYKNDDVEQTIFPGYQSDDYQSYGFEYDCNILCYMRAWGDDYCDGRNADTKLTFELQVGNDSFAGGTYSDALTFDINYGPAHCGTAFYEGNTLYIPNMKHTDDGFELCKAGDTEYCREYIDDSGYVYYTVNTSEDGAKIHGDEADVTGITEMTMQFYTWEESIVEEDKWMIEDPESKLSGVEIYNTGAFGEHGYMTYPRNQYEEQRQAGLEEYQSNWFNDLTFNPNETDWPW